MSGDVIQARMLRNRVNRAAVRLKYEFYQKHMVELNESGSHDRWKNLKKMMGQNVNTTSVMQV